MAVASPGLRDPLLAPLEGVLARAALPRRFRVPQAAGSSPACLLAALAPRRALVLVEDGDALAGALQDLRSLAPPGVRVAAFPGPHLLDDARLPLRWSDTVQRLRVVESLTQDEALWVLATPEAALSPVASPAAYARARRHLALGEELDREELLAGLVDMGYRREDLVSTPGEFASRGGIVDLYPASADRPIRIELWGDEVESIRIFDPATQRSQEARDEIWVGPGWELPRLQEVRAALAGKTLPDALEDLSSRAMAGGFSEGLEALGPWLGEACGSVVDHLGAEAPLVSLMTRVATAAARSRLEKAAAEGPDPWPALVAAAKGRPVWELGGSQALGAEASLEIDLRPVPSYVGDLARFLSEMGEATREGRTVAVACDEEGRLSRLREILGKDRIPAETGGEAPPRPGVVSLWKRDLARGFRLGEAGFQLVGEADLWPERMLKQKVQAQPDRGMRFSDWTEIEVDGLVVHVDHGIGRFLGIRPLVVGGMRQDYLELEYAKNDRLFVPVNQLDRVQRFIGVEGGAAPGIHRLGSTRWAQARSKAREDVEKLAKELLELYARRDQAPGHACGPDTVWQREMEESFPWPDTPDQTRATAEIKRDMEKSRPMDRLLCGDVGFGKTEVAIRSAFKAIQDGLQVAVLAPTTVLAQQHFQTFSQRLADFPVRIGLVSRLRDPEEIASTLKRARKGELDLLIGTHRILSKDVEFKNLGLLVIDEEQRFGVRHKERIKELRASIDVLTLTATPIPRTLNMALSGARDISTMSTPPQGRLPVRTFVEEWSDALVRGAIEKELARGGQVFYVHNRVETLASEVRRIERLVPSARIRGGHAQMDRKALETLMLDFYECRYDVLVSTTIVENGLDIPNVNTIVVDRADKLGMSQLYQLRGRVGRTSRQAFAYLLYPERSALSEIAWKRLKALEEHTELGSGFRVAMRDLELRGAGNILGKEQHGFVNAIGFELYTRLLRETVAELAGRPENAPVELAVIEIPVHAYLPEDYIPAYEERLAGYRTLSELGSEEDLEDYRRELQDRYGPCPAALDGLFRTVRLKLRATGLGLTAIRRKGAAIDFRTRRGSALPETLVSRWLRRFQRQIQFREDGLVLTVPEVREQETLRFLEELLDESRVEAKAAPLIRGRGM